MTVICPADPLEMEEATRQSMISRKPCYIRICRNNDPIVHTKSFDFTIGRALLLQEGGDIAILATGGMVKEALSTAELLKLQNITSRVVSMHTIKPIDKDMVLECGGNFKAVFTMEENNVIGGLGGAVAELLATHHIYPKVFDMFGFPDTHARVTGTRDYLNTYYKLDPQSMAKHIIRAIKG